MTHSCYIGTRDIRSRVIRGPYCIWKALFPNVGTLIIKDKTVRPWHLCDGKSPISQTAQCLRQISHNAPFCSRNVQKHISVTKWYIMGYETGALWDLYNGSIPILERRHPHNVDYLRYIDSCLFWERISDAGINCEICVENSHYDTNRKEWILFCQDDELKKIVKKILDDANLEEITMKTVCRQVSAVWLFMLF